MSQSTAEMAPVEIDTVLSANYQEQTKIWGWLRSTVNHIAALTARAGRPNAPVARLMRDIDSNRQLEATYRAKLSVLTADAAPYQAEHSRRPWNRYYLVTNTGGHVHRGMDCSTCYPTTEYAWIVDLADCNEAEMVEEYGEKACTVCFPNAPTYPAFRTAGRRNQAERDARAAEKQARADAKAAKALAAPVRVGYQRYETVAAAKQGIRDAVTYRTYYGDARGEHAATISALTAALLVKGIDQAEIDTIAAKATKKARKEAGK